MNEDTVIATERIKLLIQESVKIFGEKEKYKYQGIFDRTKSKDVKEKVRRRKIH